MSLRDPMRGRVKRTVADNTAIVERLIRRVLADSQRRATDFAFGELTYRLSFENGTLKQVKVVEETVVKPDDADPTDPHGAANT